MNSETAIISRLLKTLESMETEIEGMRGKGDLHSILAEDHRKLLEASEDLKKTYRYNERSSLPRNIDQALQKWLEVYNKLDSEPETE